MCDPNHIEQYLPAQVLAEVLGADRVGGSCHAGDEHTGDPSNDTDSGEKPVAVPGARGVWVVAGLGVTTTCSRLPQWRPCPTLVGGQGRSDLATDCHESMQISYVSGTTPCDPNMEADI